MVVVVEVEEEEGWLSPVYGLPLYVNAISLRHPFVSLPDDRLVDIRPTPKSPQAIQSAATEKYTRTNPSELKDLRKPTIFSDAIHAILTAPASVVNGQLVLDEDFLREHRGVTDFSAYAVVPSSRPRRIMPASLPDLTVEEQDDEGKRVNSAKTAKARL